MQHFLLVRRLDDERCGNQIVGIDSALAALHDCCDLSKGLQFVLGNPGATHPLARSATRILSACDAPISRFDMVIKFLPCSAFRRTFRHGGLSSQSLSSFDDFDDLARARVNHNGPVVDTLRIRCRGLHEVRRFRARLSRY